LNSGQVFIAPTRVYVQEGICQRFIERYKNALKAATAGVGDPEAESTVMGPLVDEMQFNRVTGFIERGKTQQGSLLLGGNRVGEKVK
jgi:aldehyde dehydrogenase (NAD+)